MVNQYQNTIRTAVHNDEKIRNPNEINATKRHKASLFERGRPRPIHSIELKNQNMPPSLQINQRRTPHE